MLIEIEILLALFLVAALLVMSVVDFALADISKIALRRIAEGESRKKDRLVVSLVSSRDDVLMAIHISVQTLLVALAVLLAGSYLSYPLPYAVALPAAVLTTLLVVLPFRQLIPRAIALRDPEAALERLLPVLGAAYFVLRPLVRLITAILNYFHEWEVEADDDEEASEEEIQAFIDAGKEEGILEQDEGVMIHSIVQFGDKVALEVMTPRTQIDAVDVSWTIDRLVDLVVAKRHSRIPVYRDELDNIEGIVHERDLLRVWKDEDRIDHIRSLVHPVHFVPETKPIDDLLQEMQEQGRQIVLVVDEYGGISGLITIEDLIEEIVGEIRDGTEAEGEEILEEQGGAFLVPGGTELDAIEARTGVDVFPNTESTTVGGAVAELFGRLPSSGERIRHNGFAIEVIEADRRRVRRLRVRAVTPKAQ